MLPLATNSTNDLIKYAMALTDKVFIKGPAYKKAGVIVRGLMPEKVAQGNLFLSSNSGGQLMETMDNVNFSMRNDVLKFATTGTRRFWKMRQQLRSNRYTTRWDELRVLR